MTAAGERNREKRTKSAVSQTSRSQSVAWSGVCERENSGAPGREQLRHVEDVKSGGVCQRQDCDPGKKS